MCVFLFVAVFEARGLMRRESAPLDTYAKVTMATIIGLLIDKDSFPVNGFMRIPLEFKMTCPVASQQI